MNWNTIKYFGQIKYFNVSYPVLLFVPICASFLEQINELLKIELSLPFTLKAVFVASFFYCIAIVIYQICCPPLIKENVNLQEFIDKNLEQYKNKAPDLKLNIALAQLNLDTQKSTFDEVSNYYNLYFDETDLLKKMKLKNELDTKLNSVYSSCIQRHLENTYYSSNFSRPIARWISGTLYIVATLIILGLLFSKTSNVINN